MSDTTPTKTSKQFTLEPTIAALREFSAVANEINKKYGSHANDPVAMTLLEIRYSVDRLLEGELVHLSNRVQGVAKYVVEI